MRAFCPFLIAIAVFLAMPRNAQAQLYVTQAYDRISEYDTKTGEVINPSFVTGLNEPFALALVGNTLFVTNLAFGRRGEGTVGKYDATTGAAINPSFITGLTWPDGLAVLGDTLFVSNIRNGTVGKYDASTGAAINTSFITGLNPEGLAVLDDHLFVANFDNGTVGKYDAKTGAVINASFIIGLNRPTGLALRGNAFRGNTLFVTNFAFNFPGTGTVGKYDATTGAAINPSFITGLHAPRSLALLGDKLFVVSVSKVGEYDATTGKAINANFITGLYVPFGIAVKEQISAN